jgi:transcriptional regulator with PAS, ATPase and Fis domain
MSSLETRTGSQTDESAGELDVDAEVPRLIVAMECQRPLVAGLRVALRDADEVVIGRGPAREVRRRGRTVELTLADHEMSRMHARVRRQIGGWEVTDLGSKNGTSVNGEGVARATVADGDVIEVGSIMLVFREEGPQVRGHDASDRDLATEAAAPAALRTVALEFERRCVNLARIALSTVPVIVHGETGTGKELAARAIHELSGRRGAFVAINCGALPRTLLESELFGYRRGAFSGAKDDRDGLVRSADGGTLFLDEIAELPEESQVALLRVLQEGEVRPVGGSEVVPVDVRVVAATHQDLNRRIADGRFRQDLYARLAGFAVTLPPLRDRREDIGSLIAALLPRVADDVQHVTFQRQAARALLGYAYPLNIRELEQALRAAVVLAGGREIRLEHLPEALRGHAPTTAVALRPEDRVLRERLIEVLREVRGNVAAAGRQMNKAPIQIRRWCQRLAIDLSSFRVDPR